MRSSFARVSVGLALAAWPALSGCGSSDAAPPLPADVDDDLPLPLAAGPSPTPPMGWNSWNYFGCSNLTETLIRQIADAMATNGMRDAGYRYINIDDCWHDMARGPDGALRPHPTNFPSGMKALADYVHGKGLKLGIYSDRGTATCASRPGSQDHEAQDAMTFAAWGIDYLKHDNCNAVEMEPIREMQYTAMGDALRATGREIVYSLCAWNFYEWGTRVGHLWRTTTDIRNSWESIHGNLLTNQSLAAYGGPNGWNDPDMLEVGNSNDSRAVSDLEYRSHFSLWALAAAPLIAGNDVRWLDQPVNAETKAILLNSEVIALNQDALGLQGTPVKTTDLTSVWAKPLNENGARGVILFNAGAADAEIGLTFPEVGLRAGKATVRDLWQHADLGTFQDGYSATVPAHGTVVLRIEGDEPARPGAGTVYLSDLTWTYAANGLGPVEKDRGNGASAAGDGAPISLRATAFTKGLGVSAPSRVMFRLARACSTFSAVVGVDDSTAGAGTVVFRVLADGETLWDSGKLTGASPATPVSVSVAGKRRLTLLVTNADDGAAVDRASWGDAKLECDAR